ncbi:MAG: ABC transporter permease [Methylobacteriaceae bacterium]|nr:ABC transporter permease [Methylobacteriaceae bacterium]
MSVAAALERLIGRLPIGWLQLAHSPVRFSAALAGVAFAVILILMQLGFMGALIDSVKVPYQHFAADIVISASDMNTLADGGPAPRQRMYEALAVEGVASATPLYFAKLDWKQPDGTIRSLDTFGVDPAARAFRTPGIEAGRAALMLSDAALIDRRTRNAPKGLFDRIAAGETYRFEAKGRTLTIAGLFEMGGGFVSDGYLVVSDQTFLKLFPQRAAGAPNHILLTLAQGADAAATAARLRQALPAYDVVARTVAEAMAKEVSFQTTQRPVGIVFGFGVVIGAMVGIIIVYQVLSTDVADHIREYATFKAMGYPQRFFLGVVFEEAFVLAVLGFLPGLVVSLGLYKLVNIVTALPLAMTAPRAVGVFLGTLAMCAVSGAIATRKLARADPAELF